MASVLNKGELDGWNNIVVREYGGGLIGWQPSTVFYMGTNYIYNKLRTYVATVGRKITIQPLLVVISEFIVEG